MKNRDKSFSAMKKINLSTFQLKDERMIPSTLTNYFEQKKRRIQSFESFLIRFSGRP